MCRWEDGLCVGGSVNCLCVRCGDIYRTPSTFPSNLLSPPPPPPSPPFPPCLTVDGVWDFYVFESQSVESHMDVHNDG